MGQSSSVPSRTQAKNRTRSEAQQPPETETSQQNVVEEVKGADSGLPEDNEPSSGGVQGIRRRRSTAGAPREFKRQRPHPLERESVNSTVSSVSSSHGSFETARSQALSPNTEQRNSSDDSDSVSINSHRSTESSRSGGNTLRRLRNRMRSVFSNQSESTNATPEQQYGIPAGFVNTAVPGTPGILEDLPAYSSDTRPPPMLAGLSLPTSVPISPPPEMPAPPYTQRSQNAAVLEDAAASAPDADTESVHTDRVASRNEQTPQTSQPHPSGPMTREESTQVEMLSRVLLAAASLTAVRLVDSPFRSGELYAGSNEVNAMRRRAQAEIEARRNQREREEREERNADAESEQTSRLNDINERNPMNATEAHHGHTESAFRPEEQRGRGVSTEFPSELTFAAFLEQLRTGRHSQELSNAMFGSPESNFFRVFRFNEDAEGRIPILMMGIRSAQREGRAPDGEQGDRRFEPWRNHRHEDAYDGDRNDATNNETELGFDLDEPNLEYDFADSYNAQDLDDEGSETHFRGGPELDDDDESDDSEPVFDEEGEEIAVDNPFRLRQPNDDESTRLLNSRLLNMIMGGGPAGMDPTEANPEDDGWLRPQGRRHSRADSDHSERPVPRQQQSWVIYVIGGAYPPTHPFFLAPSLMTDNPTHEDLLIAEELLGPVKRPVASQSDLDSAGGMFTIGRDSEMLNDRCPVCLMDYQEDDTCRTLNCQHTFHQDCVDNWLTRSHNTCPMCRTTGVPTSNPSRSGFAAA